MPVTIQLDVTKLSKEEAKNLLMEMLEKQIINIELLDLVRNQMSDKSTGREKKISALIDKHFDKYDDVFKALA